MADTSNALAAASKPPGLVRRAINGAWRGTYRAAMRVATFALGVPIESVQVAIEPQEKRTVRISDTAPDYIIDQPVFREWSASKAIEEGLRVDWVVFHAIDRWSKAVQQVQWLVKVRQRNGIYEVDPSDPAAARYQKLIDKPNPDMGTTEFYRIVLQHMMLAGESMIPKIRSRTRMDEASGRPAVIELNPINPDSYRVKSSRRNLIDHYEPTEQFSSKLPNINAGNMIHPRFMDPEDPRKGLPPLRPAARSVDANVGSADWNMNQMRNRVGADWAVSFSHDVGDEQYEQAREWIREDFAGSLNARTPIIVGADAKWQRLGSSALDLDWLKGMDHWEEAIIKTFGIPIALVKQDPTFNNYREARLAFWEDSVLGFLSDLEAAFNRGLTPDFTPAADPDRLRLFADVSGVRVFAALMKAKAETAKILWGMGVPFNEINARLNLGFAPVAGGDIPYVAGNLIPAGVNDPTGGDF